MVPPYSVFDTPWVAPLALILDYLLGDPALPWPHPVVFIGRLYAKLETWIRVHIPVGEKIPGRVAGAAALFLVCGITGLATFLLTDLPLAGPFFAVYLSYAGLAMGCLISTGKIVLNAIEEAPLPEAREKLSWLVSRETAEMDRPLMRKTLADTLTENFTDALCAPFFWLVLTGPVGLWVYKAVSTGDSMWGYMTEKWQHLGFACAKSDDFAAFLPARLAILAVGLYDFVISTFFPKKHLWRGRWPGVLTVHSQGLGMPSPNSGCSMTAFAWLCGARMAGPSVYFGTLVDKPWLGPPAHDAVAWDKKLLSVLIRAMEGAGLFGMFFFWLALAIPLHFTL